ncbi:MAG: efflux RND transporter periplasmic adaptor subunit [Prolixibacteraceae bacterium]
MKRTIIIIILFAVIVAMSVGIMKFLSAQKKMPDVVKAPEIVRYVKTDDVHYGNIVTTVTGKGRVFALAKVDLISEGTGKILKGQVPLKNGQTFKKGNVLFSIYKDEVELALTARKSNFLNALANLLPDIKMDYSSSYELFTQFFNAIDVNKDLPQLPEIKSEQLKMLLASRNVLSEYYSIQKDELSVKRYTVYAPFDGSYSQVNMEVGAFTNVGSKVASAISTEQVEVEIAVDAENSDFINIGDEVKLEGNTSWMGKIIRISGYVDESTQSRLVYVGIDQKKNLPLPGQYLTATFHGKMLSQVMEIPRNAVFNFNEIYTIVDGRLKKRPIEIIKKNEETLIFSGLEEGIVVVVQPLIGVSDGSKVSRLADAPKKDQGKEKMEMPVDKAQN